ncbi:hypothetical protein FGIG_11305 [Fasciola gigantica]|uniref:Uncharacterized protein n=1 Tax=Fasciola gigantica TaxID=46835 RepID=A0A504ZB42_FASGI|nr:hypothetical protein FGIG_11305 [Fasciola gigantica]
MEEKATEHKIVQKSPRKSEQLQQQESGVRAKSNIPLRQIQTAASQSSDELPTTDCMTKLHNVVMQTVHCTEQRLETMEYKVSLGASDSVFPLSTLDEIRDFDRYLNKKSNRNKLDALLASSIDDNVGNYIRSLMPRLLRKQVTLEVNYADAQKSEQLQQQESGVRAKSNIPLRQIQTAASQSSDELPTTDCMTKLHNVVMQTVHCTEQRLETMEYKVSLGASDSVFPLSTLDEIRDFDRYLNKKSNRNKLVFSPTLMTHILKGRFVSIVH